MVELVAYNKILHTTLPAEDVTEGDDLFWIRIRVNLYGSYENEFYIYKKA